METRELLDVEVVAEGLSFPEGPVALADGAVLCVEVTAGRLTRVEPDGTKSVVAELGGGPNGAAVGPDGALYVCNNGGMLVAPPGEPSIQRVDPETGDWTVLYTESGGEPLQAPNDLVFDETGHFWFTDFGGDAIHYAAPDGSRCEPVLTDVPAPNGIGLAPGGDVLVWAQTHTRQVMRRRLEGAGRVVPSPGYGILSLVVAGSVDPWVLVGGLPGGQELDSLAVDSSSSVCVGTLVESGITEFPLDGGPEDIVRWVLPDPLQDGAITNIAFGGPDLTTAYLTASLTGRLLRCRWPRPGLRLAF
jgi:gluconolactonase